jgi:hypothetical protein
MPVYTHILDTCPGPVPCSIEMESDWQTLKQFARLCPHHQSLRDGGLDDQALLLAHRASWRAKETARAAVKAELGLDKEHPGAAYLINADGSFTVLTDPVSLIWVLEDGSPGPLPLIRQNDRNRARDRALAAIATFERPAGTSQVTVE